MLSEERIKKFQEIYKNRFGVDISREEAYQQGVKIIRLLEIAYKPITVSDYEMLRERRKEIEDYDR